MQKILDSLRRVIAVAAINVESRLALTLDPAQELGPLELALTRLRSQGPIDGAGVPPESILMHSGRAGQCRHRVQKNSVFGNCGLFAGIAGPSRICVFWSC